jgi:hypothetical protein
LTEYQPFNILHPLSHFEHLDKKAPLLANNGVLFQTSITDPKFSDFFTNVLVVITLHCCTGTHQHMTLEIAHLNKRGKLQRSAFVLRRLQTMQGAL